jgi:hypothetical protein
MYTQLQMIFECLRLCNQKIHVSATHPMDPLITTTAAHKLLSPVRSPMPLSLYRCDMATQNYCGGAILYRIWPLSGKPFFDLARLALRYLQGIDARGPALPFLVLPTSFASLLPTSKFAIARVQVPQNSSGSTELRRGNNLLNQYPALRSHLL